jgi:phospholipid-binding lipoprotein MlaA
VNEVSFGAVQSVDKAIIAPIAYGYRDGLPGPIRDGMHNVLNNLDEPVVFLNFLLQLKIGKAAETVGRFAINSTIGVAGLFDVAKKHPINLPRRPNGLADTLGYYGVGPGPYLFLPVFGSTTVRDLLGRVVDLSLLPAAVGKPFTNPIVSATKGTLSSIDDRVENDVILTRIQESGNPYAAMREYYLKQRQAEIDVLKGKRSDANIDLNELEFLDSLPAPTNERTQKSSAPKSQ